MNHKDESKFNWSNEWNDGIISFIAFECLLIQDLILTNIVHLDTPILLSTFIIYLVPQETYMKVYTTDIPINPMITSPLIKEICIPRFKNYKDPIHTLKNIAS